MYCRQEYYMKHVTCTFVNNNFGTKTTLKNESYKFDFCLFLSFQNMSYSLVIFMLH